MVKINDNNDLVNYLITTLPVLSDFIQEIVKCLPDDLDGMDIDKLDEVLPIVRQMSQFTRENIYDVRDIIRVESEKNSPEIKEDTVDINRISELYIEAISNILESIERLYSYLLQKEGSSEDDIFIFIDKLFDGSVGILKLVDEITQ